MNIGCFHSGADIADFFTIKPKETCADFFILIHEEMRVNFVYKTVIVA